MLRGSGMDWDLRRDQPYESYDFVKPGFEVPIGRNGDSFDRYVLRMKEMQESVNIMAVSLAALNMFYSTTKSGSTNIVRVDDMKLVNPPRKDMKMSMESVIHHFKYFSTGISVPPSLVSAMTEAPKGEFGVILVNRGGNKPYRCKIKAPGFFHLQGLDFMAQNHFIADVVTIIGTQDIVFGEVDR